MRTTTQMRQHFHQLTTPSGPKRPRDDRDDSQGWPGRPNEGDKWAKREASKRQITQESSGDNDNDGRQTPPKQIRVHTGGTDSRDQSSEVEHPKEDTKQ